jgi:hypothetical protein
MDTNLKLQRKLKSGLKPFQVKFVGEMVSDAGGLKREFFSLIFEDSTRHILQSSEDTSLFCMTFKNCEMVTSFSLDY